MFRHASPEAHHVWITVEGGSVAFEVREALVLRLDEDLVVDPRRGDQNVDEVSPFSPQIRFSSVSASSASLKWPYLIFGARGRAAGGRPDSIRNCRRQCAEMSNGGRCPRAF